MAMADTNHTADRFSEDTRPLSGSSFGSATSFQEDLDEMDEEGSLVGRQRPVERGGGKGLFQVSRGADAADPQRDV